MKLPLWVQALVWFLFSYAVIYVSRPSYMPFLGIVLAVLWVGAFVYLFLELIKIKNWLGLFFLFSAFVAAGIIIFVSLITVRV